MKVLKRIWAQLHRFVFWALVLSLLWSWIYTFVGDTSREKKIILCVDAYALEPRALSLRLEDEGLPPGIKMIQVRSFGYDFLGNELEGDVYLMKGSILQAALEETPGKLAAFALPAGTEGYAWENANYGLKVFDPETQHGPAMAYIQYTPLPDPEREAYYLCFDAAGCHLAANPGAIDNAAWELAMTLCSVDP